MHKKRTLILMTFCILLFSSTLAIAAGDVAYIYRKSFRVDNKIINVFNNLGLTVDLIKENELPIDLSSYKMLFIGDENFRNPSLIPVNEFPTVVTNYHYSNIWGYSDKEGVSQIASTNPLSVLVNGNKIKVYTKAVTSNKLGISYYYLDRNNKAPVMTQIAAAGTTSSGFKIGDVISKANAGDKLLNGKTQQGNLCFFGIIESNFWTPAAEDLLEDCISHVISQCTQNSDCPSPEFSAPFCSFDGDVQQTQTTYSCQNGLEARCEPNEQTVLLEECEFGCENGQCIVQCSSNSDCGTDRFINGPFCSLNNVNQNFETFTCNNANLSNSFCTSEILPRNLEICSDTCLNGQCITVECNQDEECNDFNPLTEDFCQNPGTQFAECRNTPLNCGTNNDCGFTGFVGNEFCSENNVNKNFQTAICNNPGTLNSFCSVTVEQQLVNECESACSEGSCISCNTNQDCSDNNPQTNDVCENPGLPESFCTNIDITPMEVACSNDSECGTNTLISQPYCSENNLTELARTWTCNSPGLPESFCSSDIEEQLIKTCNSPDICWSNECLTIACFTHDDCSDNNETTLDLCTFSGTPDSFCTNTPLNIICTQNSDCGADGFIGDNICLGTNVTRLSQEFTCNNPNTPESFCSAIVRQDTIETCSIQCSQGQCTQPAQCGNNNLELGEECDDGNTLNNDGCSASCHIENPGECFSNLDCEDSIDLTFDQCHNAGTPDSFCTNTEINCAIDAHCGIDEFIGNEFCSSDSIFKNFRNGTCNNAGTPLSFCTVIVSPELVTMCDFACTEGACISCDENLDCNDSNPLTDDICQNPGTLESFCTNEQIPCTQNSDCGIDGFINEPFCIEKNITQTFEAFTCNNPGTTDSFCTSEQEEITIEMCSEICFNAQCLTSLCSIDSDCGTDQFIGNEFCIENDIYRNFENVSCENPGEINAMCMADLSQVLIEECSYACTDGICIRCDENLDCNDSNPLTDDICQNPGTLESSCENTSTCTDECTFGEKQCIGSGFQVCGDFDGNGCTEWSGISDCGFGRSCTNGECLLVGTNECTFGEKQCIGSGFQVCGDFDGNSLTEWSGISDCGFGRICTAGECVRI